MKKAVLFVLFVGLLAATTVVASNDEEDFDEDEFEYFEVEGEAPEANAQQKGAAAQKPKRRQPMKAADDEDLDSDFEDLTHFADDEEFEGYVKPEKTSDEEQKREDPVKLKVPVTKGLPEAAWEFEWSDFWVELLMLIGLVVYAVNYMMGRKKNLQLAQTWSDSNRKFFEENFSLVGFEKEFPIEESASEFVLYGSGRVHCQKYVAQLDLLKRHDLLSVMTDLVSPNMDTLSIEIDLDTKSMAPFIFAVMPKSSEKRIRADVADIGFFCQTYNGEKWNLPSNLSVLTDCPEIVPKLLNFEVVKTLTDCKDELQLVHFSDQFVQQMPTEDDAYVSLASVTPRKSLFFKFLVPKEHHHDLRRQHLIVKMSIYFVDLLASLVLSPQAKSKADKSRMDFTKKLMKPINAQRASQAQEKREQKRLEEKKQAEKKGEMALAKWEEKDKKRDMKRKQGKMKMMAK